MQNHDPNEDTGGPGLPADETPAPAPKEDRSVLIAVIIVAIIVAIILL